MTLTPGMAWLAGYAAMIVVMAALWFVQRARRDASLVDVAWTLGLGALAIGYALVLPGPPARRALVAGMACVWSLRLGSHLLRERVLGKPEDPRYQKMRREWGEAAQRKFFEWFQIQAFAAALFSLPFLLAMGTPTAPMRGWDWLALAILAVSVTGESLADHQLARFRAVPADRGRTCRSGLWGWSRHPNYFFEWLHWWSYVPLAVGAPLGWLAFAFPLLMLHVLLNLSGIPLNEARALETRGDDYREYQRTVSRFVPLPPRRTS